MNARGRSQVIIAVIAGLIATTGCGRSNPSAASGARPGVTGTSYLVTVGRQPGGTVTSSDGRINCGTGGSACGPVSYAWSDTVVLTATPDAGNMFGTWAGDCLGRALVCTLDTSKYGADKYVVAVFGAAGRTQHPNWSDLTPGADGHAIHGREALAWFARTPGYFECTYCHGASYNGVGIAPSCNGCHARNGFPQATDCNTCHTSPPPPPHPAVTNGIAGCNACHPTSVDPSGNIVADGTHMNGRLDGGGHEDGFGDPAVHGVAFFQSLSAAGSSCTGCHGQSYEATIANGQSCTTCHAAAGFPNWLANCTFCHGAPPPPAPAGIPAGTHPTVSSDLTTCSGCHATSIDASGNSIAGGTHMNGDIDGGHAAGFVQPSVHGRAFFEWISGTGGTDCTQCHGTSYELTIANGRSCNTCHAAATTATPPGGGWSGTDWKTNCTFCHGTRTIAYASPGDLNDAAPPDAISQRLGGGAAPERTGAHAIHLAGSALAGPVLCSNCHTVPGTFAHINGREARATVIVQGPGASGPEAGYQADGSCMTRCHGSSASPVWTFSGIACSGCHGIPPATSIHSGVSVTTECAFCHENTVTSGGTIDVAGGRHVNGQVDAYQHAAGFALPVNHGPAYLDHLAGAPGALDCASCHGTSLAYCDSCHSQPANGGWVSWQTNCTFCHGTKTPIYSAADINASAPPDAIQQRLDGTPVPTRTGQHTLHVNDGGFVPMQGLACGACHPDPAGGTHVSADRRAAVTIDAAQAFPGLTAAELARLPSPFATYNPSTNGCTSYCHNVPGAGGNNTAMNWTIDFDCTVDVGCTPAYTPIFDCQDCHGLPPPTGSTTIGHTYPTAPLNTRYCGTAGCANHLYHRQALQNNGYDSCGNCHLGSANTGTYTGIHVNGKYDVVFGAPSGRSFTATWDATARTCLSTCHTQSGTGVAHTW